MKLIETTTRIVQNVPAPLSFSVIKGNGEWLCLEKQKEANHTLRLDKI